MSGEYRLEYDPGAKDATKHVPGVGLTDANNLGLDKGTGPTSRMALDGMRAYSQNYLGNNEFDILQKYNEAYKVDVNKDLLVPAARGSQQILPYKVQPSLSNDIRFIRISLPWKYDQGSCIQT
jgi:hypothetical protein